MRMIWKDSNKPKEYKPIKYRGYMIYGTPRGWTITLRGDYNIYANHYCAKNAIDLAIDGCLSKGTKKRLSYGVQIIGREEKR